MVIRQVESLCGPDNAANDLDQSGASHNKQTTATHYLAHL